MEIQQRSESLMQLSNSCLPYLFCSLLTLRYLMAWLVQCEKRDPEAWGCPALSSWPGDRLPEDRGPVQARMMRQVPKRSRGLRMVLNKSCGKQDIGMV